MIEAVEPVGGHGPDRGRVDRAERAEADPRGPQRLAVAGADHGRLPVGADQLERLDLRGDVAEPGPGPVRAGRDRAREGLTIDVAEVLEGDAELVQPTAQIAELGACLNPDQTRGAVEVEDPVERLDPQQRAPIGHQRRLAERVPGARDLDLAAGFVGLDDRRDEPFPGPRPDDRMGPADLLARPVAPGEGLLELLFGHRREPTPGSGRSTRRATARPRGRVR